MKMQCKTCGHQMTGSEVIGYVIGGWFIKLEERFGLRGWGVGDTITGWMIGFAKIYRIVCSVCDKPGVWERVDEGIHSVKKDY